ncbi:outer spore coat protein CotE [Sulfoacidibacillus thermotolerans]|uniref:Spore coat protein n=1 Tax=Sulfoacidibacillus thermotolerans TaxID=1765684 RepID=A0A2U3DAG2_SULT2|nr:outer spore coat protein CotE [Sulfoacidibacillus thermotolerans]PWI58279.1 spore coat protein [Sulfoacidibacillus thermotolerans]
MLAKDTGCREIITSAVCGKGSKYAQSTYTIRPANRPTTIGGCWVMNHSCEATLAGDTIEVHGRFDINVWYSYNGNSETAVAKDTVPYVEHIALQDLDPHCFHDDLAVTVKMVQQPNCLDATIVDGGAEIAVRVELELAVEVVGRTKIWVLTCEPTDKKESFEDESSLEDDSRL